MITEIHSLQEPGIEMFSTLTEAQLRNKLDAEKGLFIAESPKVIRVALQAGYQPQALLCERRQIEAKALRKLRHPNRSKRLRDYLE